MSTKVYSIISGKGGVGKTTLTSNLSYLLASMEQKTLAIDSNFTVPDLSIHLGLHLYKYNLGDVLRNAVSCEKAILSHPSGFDVIPGSLTLSSLASFKKIDKVISDLIGKYDYILLDSPAGLGKEVLSIISASDNSIIVTNPELPSITNALKAIRICEKLDKEIECIVLNRVGKRRGELSEEKVREILNYDKIFIVPEDKNIQRSISANYPLSYLFPNSPASLEFKRIAYYLANREFKLSFFDLLKSRIGNLF